MYWETATTRKDFKNWPEPTGEWFSKHRLPLVKSPASRPNSPFLNLGQPHQRDLRIIKLSPIHKFKHHQDIKNIKESLLNSRTRHEKKLCAGTASTSGISRTKGNFLISRPPTA